ncbi:hypothetical protein DINM_000339 [Dirofilaria immitis]|nr:hypothetical protein [Dirofilaria immitis]
MWRQLPRGLVFNLGKRVFEIIFARDPNLLIIINLEHLQNTDQWQEHINFRMHAQRFTHALSQSMRNLSEPVVAADRLQEFGAAYVNQEDITYGGFNACIPHSYWNRLSTAIIMTAKEFLNKQQLKVMLELKRDNYNKYFCFILCNISISRQQFLQNDPLTRVGFEPTPPKRLTARPSRPQIPMSAIRPKNYLGMTDDQCDQQFVDKNKLKFNSNTRNVITVIVVSVLICVLISVANKLCKLKLSPLSISCTPHTLTKALFFGVIVVSRSPLTKEEGNHQILYSTSIDETHPKWEKQEIEEICGERKEAPRQEPPLTRVQNMKSFESKYFDKIGWIHCKGRY